MPDPLHPLAADATFAVFLAFVGIAVTTEAALGFGSILIALTLGALFYPVATLLPLLVCMNVMLTSYIVARHHRHVAWRLLLANIIPTMGAGMVAGYVLFVRAPESFLRTFLGLFVTAVAALQLVRVVLPNAAARPFSSVQFAATALAAGIVHGMMATGGPLLVYALNRLGLDKSAFRSTLACLWVILNGSLIVAYAAGGRLGGAEAPFVAALLPVVAAAIAAGEWLHGRFDERTFRIAVLALLLIAGLALLA